MIKIYSINNYCSQKKLIKLAVKCSFFVKEGKRHMKIHDKSGKIITTIPRHGKIKIQTAKSIVKVLIENGAEIQIIKG